MTDTTPGWNQVWLGTASTDDSDGYYPIVGNVSTLSTATFAPKNTIGDYTKDSEDYISSLILSDMSGGINIEDMNEGSDAARVWTAFADIRRPGKIALNPKVEALTWSGASGTSYPLGAIGETVYTIIGSEIAGWNEASSTFYTEEAVTLVPAEKPVSYIGKLFVPCGASGYMIVTESATGNPTVTNVTTGVGVPAAYDPDALDTSSPLPVAFWVFDQRLWALTTSGALCWSFTGANNEWTWPYDEARAWYPKIQSGTTPQRIIGFYNPNGDPTLVIVTNRGAFLYNWSVPSIIDTPVQFPPHPDFGGAVCVWRAAEDLHIGMGLDTCRYTAANVVVPLSGLARDDGVPQELRGRIVDLEPETSEMYALVAPSSSGESAFAYNDTVGSAGTSDGQFADVRGLSVDSAGHVFACDEDNERVQEFDDALTFVAKFGASGTGNGQFASNNGPFDCAHDSSDNLFVVDRGNSRVQKFTAANAYSSQFGSFDDGTPAVAGSETWTLQNTFGSTGSGNDNYNSPAQVAVDASGNTYVADGANGRIVKRSGSGTFVSSITGISSPEGVAVDSSGNIYVAYDHEWLRKYNSVFSLQWTQHLAVGLVAGHCVTDGTHVYVTDQDAGYIYKRLCSTGASVGTFGGPGTTNGLFDSARGIASDGTYLYVVDVGNARVQKLSLTGTYVSQWSIPASCRGIAFDGSRLLVADFANDLVKRYSTTGTLLDSFSQADPDGIGVASDGTVWVTNAVSDNLTEWEFVVVGEVPAEPPDDGTFNLPQSIAIKQTSGRIYVADTSNHRVQYFTSSGTFEGKFGSSAYSATTGAITAGSANGEFNTPVGIAVNQTSGDVYVVDQGNDRIQQFTATGTFVRKWGSSGTGDGQFSVPTAIAINPANGNVFVTDSTRDDVQEFSSAGVFIRKFGSSGSTDGKFNNASGIAFDSTGASLYVADLTNEDVQEFIESAVNASNTYPWLAAWTGIGWYGKWKGPATAVIPTWAIVTSTSSAYRLWWGMGDSHVYTTKLRRYFHNPRQGLLAGIDEYEDEGEIVTAKFDAAMLGNWKLASHMVAFMDNATEDETITIEYRVDANDGWTLLGTVDSTEKTYLPFAVDANGRSTGVAFNWIQFRIRLFRGSDATQTPIIKSLVFCYLKIPQNSSAYNFVVAFPTDEYNGRTGAQIRADLDTLIASKEMVFLRLHEWDGDEREFRGYLTQVNGEDSPSDLVDGSRAVSFIRIASEEV